MALLLDDQGLHEFIGGRPRTLEELREAYTRQVVGRSADGAQGWLNWIVRDAEAGSAVGTVQATLQESDGSMTADIAWVIGSSYQGRGYAKEAAYGMLAWLREQNVNRFRAHIHPGHAASTAVAHHLGLRATDRLTDGEVLWVSADRC